MEYGPEFKPGDYVTATEAEANDHNISVGDVFLLTSVDNQSVFFTDKVGNSRYRPKDRYRHATPAEIEQYNVEKALEAAYSGQENDDDMVDTVTIPMMTLTEATEKRLDPYTMGYLGLIRAETAIERFERHHGGLDDNQRAIVEIYQNWLDASQK